MLICEVLSGLQTNFFILQLSRKIVFDVNTNYPQIHKLFPHSLFLFSACLWH